MHVPQLRPALAYLSAGLRACGPGTLPGAPGRPLHLPWLTLSVKASTTAFGSLRKSRPSILNELKTVVEACTESVDQEEVKRSARGTRKRARACKAVAGDSFECSLKKILRGLEQ